LENDLRENSYVTPIKITVSKYLDEWFAIHKKSLQPGTVKAYEYNIKHIKDAIGGKYLQRLTPGDIEEMYKNFSQYSGKTLREIHSLLSIAMKAAVRKKYLINNPCDAVDRPKAVKYQAAFVHPDDVGKYLSTFDGKWMYPAVALSLFCGLRRGELLGLRWADVDYKHGRIEVNHSVSRIDGKNVLKRPKNNRVRTVNMPAGVSEILKAHRKTQLEHQLFLGDEYHKSDFIITREDGAIPAPTYLSKCFTDNVTRAGLKLVRLHDLRHTAASLMIYEGADLKTVSSVLGHSSINITADIYAHVIDEAKKKAADSLDKYIKQV
jgi:integrase